MTKQEETIRLLNKFANDYLTNKHDQELFEHAIECVKERKAGKWIEQDGYDGDTYYDCSACGESWVTIEGTPWDNGMNYCPNCGAKMEGAEDEGSD